MSRSRRRPTDPFKTLKGSFVSDAERLEFLAALEQFDPEEEEGLPSGPQQPQAQPRRLKQLERGQIKPEATLDLHGLSRTEALARARAFLGHASRQGWPAVVIVTGKGLHSPDGPVLRLAIEQLLASSAQLVLEWAPAPRLYGGGGALVVFPRRGDES